jgi:hypothetical protein
MVIHRLLLILLLLSVWPAAGVLAAERPPFGSYTDDEFRDYWYNRGAEISRFTLQQARYGEIHGGDAVLVFVTEPMNPAIQIKADERRPENIPILKLNATRKFFTGIYPYSVMTSVFAPLDTGQYPLPLKISTSVQEWCGHIYTQMNLRDDVYRIQMHSYFEEEGDQAFTLERTIPEDALWTLMRIAPQNLPQGTFRMIPGTVYARLMHRPLMPRRAEATMALSNEKSVEGNRLVRYEVTFPEEKRTLRIFFEQDFPYRIQQWEEANPGLRRGAAPIMTTRAVRTHTLMIASWQHNGNQDRGLLKKLGLAAREMGSN